MKTSLALSAMLLLVIACKKEDAPGPAKPPTTPAPEMLYTDLQNREMKHNQPQVIDLDNNGSADIAFSTWYIGDPIEKEDEILFFAVSYIHSNLLTTGSNNSPVFKQGDSIAINDQGGFHWYQVA